MKVSEFPDIIMTIQPAESSRSRIWICGNEPRIEFSWVLRMVKILIVFSDVVTGFHEGTDITWEANVMGSTYFSPHEDAESRGGFDFEEGGDAVKVDGVEQKIVGIDWSRSLRKRFQLYCGLLRW